MSSAAENATKEYFDTEDETESEELEETEPLSPSGHIPEPPGEPEDPATVYESTSTIDNPPRESRFDRQEELPGMDSPSAEDREDSRWNVALNLTLKIKMGSGETITLPLLQGECHRAKVVETIDRKIFGKQIQSWLAGIIGDQEYYRRLPHERMQNVHWKDSPETSEDVSKIEHTNGAGDSELSGSDEPSEPAGEATEEHGGDVGSSEQE